MTTALAATLLALSLLGAFLAGLLGVGGAIVMIPLLLYGPPLLGAGQLEVKTVAAVTMVQVFVASVSGMLAHRRLGSIDSRLVWIGGGAMASGSLVGALGSKYVHEFWLLVVFAVMVTAAAVLMVVPTERMETAASERTPFSRARTVAVAGTVGVAAGLVGAGGAFLLVPLLLVAVGVPIRMAIGSSLAITALGATAGVIGKVATGQVPLGPALVVCLGAIAGAQLGVAASRRVSGSALKRALLVVIVLIGARVWWSVLFR